MSTEKAAENLVQKICTKLGEDNNPIYAVMAIATCKGILRPTFTMHDKKQDPQTKKYAAFREGVTEMVAIPSYFIFGTVAGKLAPKLLDLNKVKDANGKTITTELRQKFDDALAKKHDKTDVNAFKNAVEGIEKAGNKDLFKSYDKALQTVGATTKFAGVCVAALLFIPSMCNVVMPPIMNAFKKIQDKKQLPEEAAKPQITSNIAPVAPKTDINKPTSNSNLVNMYLAQNASSGMRVGG